MSHKVLLIACREESRDSLYLLSQVLESCGYSSENSHVDTGGESKIKIDRIMEAGMSLSDFLGVVFFDDGGDVDVAKDIAKKALSGEKVLGGMSVHGCQILSEIGALKDAYVCGGLPEKFYKGSKGKVDSPSVRSDKIITGVGECAQGFGVVLVDALGGKIKRVIKSKDTDENVKVTAPDQSVDPSHGKVIMTRGSGGWRITKTSFSGDVAREAHEAALHAVIVAQSECDSPDDMSDATVSVSFNDEGPKIDRVENDSSVALEKKKKMIQLERELAREGVFMQPDGSVYLRGNPRGRCMGREEAIGELMRLALESLEEEITDGEKADPWTSLCSRRHRHVLRCLLALLDLNGQKTGYRFAYYSGGPGLGATSIGGPNFGTAISDMDMRARVWPAKEDEEWMKDREDVIEDLGRYNPEYVERSQADPNAYGVYYVWPELNRGPIDWSGSIKEMKDKSPYKINDALKP